MTTNLLTAPLTRAVPPTWPTKTSRLKLAIVGEAPGADEERYGKPFIGYSGTFLWNLLKRQGYDREHFYVGNVAQHKPPANDIKYFKWGGREIQDGLRTLRDDIPKVDPNLVLLLGKTALRAAGVTEPITDFRGTTFMCNDADSPFVGRKCMAAYHPAAVLRNYSWAPVLDFDIRRAVREAETATLDVPQRTFDLDLSSTEIVARLVDIRQQRTKIALDIEGGIGTMSCLSIATSPHNAFIIPFSGGDGNHWANDEDEVSVWQALAATLQDPHVPKILQNSLYDQFVLAYSYGIHVQGVVDDTMLKHWELYSELEKGLGFQTSIYTKEPYYKGDIKTLDRRTFHTYCCKDSAVTYEISDRLDAEVKAGARGHYDFNVGMLRPLLYMELRGIRYDVRGAKQRQERVKAEADALEAKLELEVGHPLNPRSPKQMQAWLYDELKLPTKIHRKTGKPTANYEAVLTLYKSTGNEMLGTYIRARKLGTRAQMLSIKPDDDGRIRCGYNVVGSETGRLTCYTSPTGSGYNLQTIPAADRDLFLADLGYDMFSVDLAGADGWTVAAHCARLGDPTMLDDLWAGIKIAKLLTLMFKHGPRVAQRSREDILRLCGDVSKDDPLYFGAKCCQHGSNYGMHEKTMAATAFTRSEGEVLLSTKDAKMFQSLYILRYPGVHRYHKWGLETLQGRGFSVSASGHIRRYFGRKSDQGTVREFLANEPQENTTYATNLAAWRLWTDPENRTEKGALIVEPLHQVHDALVGQWPTARRDWARRKIHSWFNNELTIAGVKITIPYEGGYGPSWGKTKEAI